MSKLRDILNKRKVKTEPQVVEHVKPIQRPIVHNNIWLSKVSDKFGYIPSTDNNKINGILKALDRREGHCPCGGNGKQFICPCHIMQEKGICKCGLFQNIESINPIGNSSATIKHENN